MKKLYHVFRLGIDGFMADDCLTSGAAIAFYVTIGLPPLLVLIFFVGDALGIPRGTLEGMVREQLGLPALQSLPGGLTGMAQSAQEHTSIGEFGLASKVLGVVMMVVSASGVFAQLQQALNRAWNVTPDPRQGGWHGFIFKRLLSISMIVVICFVLLVSLVITTLMDELLRIGLGQEPEAWGTFLGLLLDSLTALAVATLLFGLTYKILPDAVMAWRDVWLGALLTAVLFATGKSLLGWWLPQSEEGGAWGAAASSMVAMLLWVYYNSLIVLFGAEVTQAWAQRYGAGVRAEPGAVRTPSQPAVGSVQSAE